MYFRASGGAAHISGATIPYPPPRALFWHPVPQSWPGSAGAKPLRRPECWPSTSSPGEVRPIAALSPVKLEPRGDTALGLGSPLQHPRLLEILPHRTAVAARRAIANRIAIDQAIHRHHHHHHWDMP